MSVRALAAHELKLATIAYRIATTNVHACPVRQAMSGMVLHDLTRYDQSLRPAIARAFSINGGVGVLGVIPGSAAEKAGLRVDDEILQIGPYPLYHSQAFSSPKSFSRMEQFDRVLQAAMTYGESVLTVRRQGVQLRLPMRASYGCGGKLTLSNSDTKNAWADGRNVLITTGMTALSNSDDEIAFVIAHEMAHNILGHLENKRGKRGIFGTRRAKNGEIEADERAVELMSNGGYRPAGGIAFLENARRRMWWSFSLDHPGFGRRIAVVNAAIQRASLRDLEFANALPRNSVVPWRPLASLGYDEGATRTPLLSLQPIAR